MAEHTGDKSQEATPHRRQQALEQGQVARSQDLAAAVLLVVGLAALLILGGSLSAYFAGMMQRQLGGDAWLAADSGVRHRRSGTPPGWSWLRTSCRCWAC